MLRTTLNSTAMSENDFEVVIVEQATGGFVVRLRDPDSKKIIYTVAAWRGHDRVFKTLNTLMTYVKRQWPDRQEFVLILNSEPVKGDSNEEAES